MLQPRLMLCAEHRPRTTLTREQKKQDNARGVLEGNVELLPCVHLGQLASSRCNSFESPQDLVSSLVGQWMHCSRKTLHIVPDGMGISSQDAPVLQTIPCTMHTVMSRSPPDHTMASATVENEVRTRAGIEPKSHALPI